MQLPTEFHHPPFDSSEVITLTNISTKNDFAKNIRLAPLCYTSEKLGLLS